MNRTKEAILKDAIAHYGRIPQLHKAMEELAELIRAISRDIDKRTPENDRNVAEEIADVRIMLAQLEIMYNNREEVREIEWMKLIRLIERMEAEKT